ncbi:wall-associated receptor kinase-like 20 [Aristolochia californica]|uniref:wall-associated receptor kinase-like 20 n=1 Tax=Aristolochia californica TaxID=171875 RepID=UPI0035DB26E5
MTPPRFVFFFLLISAAAITVTGRTCPPCGNLSVPYPLSTSATCGDAFYKLRCVSNATLLLDGLNGSSYQVSAILPVTQRLVVRPSTFVPGACVSSDLPTQGLQLNDTLPFNVTSSNTIMFFNCSDSLLRSPLNCSEAGLCHKYIDDSVEGRACSGDANSSRCCTFRAGGSTTSYWIRIRGPSGCSAYRSFVNLDPALPVAQWPASGLEIQWQSPREPLCETQGDCEAGVNATCAADPAGPGTSRCFCVPGLLWDPFSGTCTKQETCRNPEGCDGSSNRTPLIAGLTCGLGVLLLVSVGGFFFYKRQRRIKDAKERLAKEREEILNAGGKYAKVFTGKEIKKATNGFSRDLLLGSGGYGEVFKGIIEDGTVVAVKCAKLGNTKSTDQVLNEVRILAQVNHRSLVKLLGCCVELQQPLMVYEYILNGTLYEHLHGLRPEGRSSLPWRRRLIIAHQTAEGLAYLHSSAVPPIYHRDVKSSNILLDDKLNAKVSDFGLSRLAETDLSHISTCAQGTLGYLDPEYYRNYQLTDKSDVYSFGVVLLELLTSQKAIDFNREADDVNLAVFVQRKVDEEKILDTVDVEIKAGATQLELDTMKALVFLAMGCLEEKRQNRPAMKEVAEEIEYIMSIEEAKEDSAG